MLILMDCGIQICRIRTVDGLNKWDIGMSWIIGRYFCGCINRGFQDSCKQLSEVKYMYSLLRSFLAEDQATLVFIMLITIPLSFVLGRLRNKYMIFCFSFVCSVAFQCVVFPQEKYFLWVQQQIVYLMLVFCPRRIVGTAILLESFAFLCGIQIRRMYISYAVNNVDITAILMMQMFLYVGVGYNYQRGMKPDHELTEEASKRKILERPDYFTYMGYVFFMPSCLVGPVFEYRDYEDYLNRKGDYQDVPLRSTLKAAFNQLLILVLTVGLYVGLSRFELYYTITQQFDAQNLLYKLFYIAMAIVHIEFKYISAWSLGLISVHMSGLSYNAPTEKFDKIQVTKLYGFFFDPSIKVKAECWNMPVQNALKRYIYEAIYDPKGNYPTEKAKKKVQGKAQMYTFMCSAVWHGLYPGYFMSFLHWMVFLRITQEVYRVRRAVPSIDQLYKKLQLNHIENIISQYVLLYFGISFHVMTWENIKTIIVTTYGLPFIVLYLTYVVVVKMKGLSFLEKGKQAYLEKTKKAEDKE